MPGESQIGVNCSHTDFVICEDETSSSVEKIFPRMKLKELVVKTVYIEQNIILKDIVSFGQKLSDGLMLF